jgi:ribosomal protein S18 acetylase RimI-like enzyme
MAEAFDIRPLGAADLAAYKALRDEMLARHEEAFNSDAAAESQRVADSYRSRLGLDGHDESHFTLGAWQGQRLVGAISFERDMRTKVRHTAHVVGMMVRHDVQGRGVGRALLAALVARAAAMNEIDQLTLTVTAGNTAAVTLYQRAGFTRYGMLPRATKLDGRYHDKDLMVLTLR